MLAAMSDELANLYDDQGRVCGTAARSRIRRENLRHGGTGILVTNSRGEVYVHRRTDTKDVYPGWYDLAAGGMVSAGEEPEEAARRELAEELGIEAPLVFVKQADYRDEQLNLHAWLYRVVWDGPVHHQASEVAWGGWMTPAQVQELVDDPDRPVMPDAVELWRDVLGAPGA